MEKLAVFLWHRKRHSAHLAVGSAHRETYIANAVLQEGVQNEAGRHLWQGQPKCRAPALCVFDREMDHRQLVDNVSQVTQPGWLYVERSPEAFVL